MQQTYTNEELKKLPSKILISRFDCSKYFDQVSSFAIELKYRSSSSEKVGYSKIVLENTVGFKCVYFIEGKDEDNQDVFLPILIDLPKVLYLKNSGLDKQVYASVNNDLKHIGKVIP